jgi:hypothetical protein
VPRTFFGGSGLSGEGPVVADAPLLLLLGEAGTGWPAIDLKGSSEVAVSRADDTPVGEDHGHGGGDVWSSQIEYLVEVCAERGLVDSGGQP